jgi:hypothetical protein
LTGGVVPVALGLAMFALACSAPGGPGGPTGTTMVPDSGPAGPFDITIASTPPIELPGTVLWLDADFGVARDGAQVRAWTDRSGFGHIFQREAAGDPGPTTERLAGHGALHFGGHARMALSGAVEERARAALTIGSQDFLIALVVRPDRAGDSTLFALAAPEAQAPVAMLRLQPVGFVLGESAVTTSTSLDGLRLVVVTRRAGTLVVRVDGQDVGAAEDRPLELPFLAPFVGGWDLGAGFGGGIGDVVMVVGPELEGAVVPLEGYLRQKYGL